MGAASLVGSRNRLAIEPGVSCPQEMRGQKP